MRFSSGFVLRVAVPAAIVLVSCAAAPAQTVEPPPSFNAAQIAGITRVGPNYTVVSPVPSDGLLRVYTLNTPYGEFTARGDAMLRMRTRELVALSQLEQVSTSKSFTAALAQAGLNPLKYAGSLIRDPLKTVSDTFAGVGAMFGRIKSGFDNAGQTPDNAMASLLGVTSEKRQLAAAYGVDPYTDFPPLKAKLDQLAEAAAAGGLAVTGALFAVPGAAGIVASNLSTANKLSDVAIDELARKYTAAQILDLNRARLKAMGIDPALSAALLANRNYTPIDMAAMVAALDSMAAVQDRHIFVARAAGADVRFAAYATRRRAELLADDYRRHRNYVRFVNLGAFPFVATRDGKIEALAPIDALAWTRETSAVFGEVTAARKIIAPKARGELRLTGEATPLAKKYLAAQGWAVLERQ